MAAAQIDWERVEADYRAGQLSVSEIGRQNHISHTAINKRAKKEGWTRSLVQRVKDAVRNGLVSDGVSKSTANETVEQAAARVIQIVREHRADIMQGRKIVRSLLDELSDAANDLSLIERSKIINNVSNAMKNVIGLERQSFNLGDGDGDEADKPSGILVKFVGSVAQSDG